MPHRRNLFRQSVAITAVLVSSFQGATARKSAGAREMSSTLNANGAEATACSASVTTIRNAADATPLAACSTFTGNIEISAVASGSIALDGIQTLQGYLNADSSEGLSSISADSLEVVEGYMYLEELGNLDSLNMPKLKTVGRQLRLIKLPALSTLGFGATVSNCSSFLVSQTALGTLEGVDPEGTTNGFNATDNNNLDNITMSVESTTASDSSMVVIKNNAPGLQVSFPNLATAQRLDIENATGLSLPQLTEANDLVLIGNAFTEFSAPKLQGVGNDVLGILIQSNQGLTEVDLPALARIGGLTVQDNARLQDLSLPKLQTSPQGVVLEGNLANVSFPSLQKAGRFILNTSSSNFDCSPFQEYKNQNIITGSLTCTTTSQHNSTSPTPTPNSSGLSTGAKIGIGVGVGAAGVLGLVLGVIFCCKRRRRGHAQREQRRVSENTAEIGHGNETPPLYESIAQLPANGPETMPGSAGKGGTGEMSRRVGELEAANPVFELQSNREFVELAGDQPREG